MMFVCKMDFIYTDIPLFLIIFYILFLNLFLKVVSYDLDVFCVFIGIVHVLYESVTENKQNGSIG